MNKNRQFITVAALLAAVTAGAFWRATGCGFVFDDKQYILANPHVQNGLNWADIKWAFTSMYASNWHPLTWISHMLDNQFWALDPAGPHLTNVVLHIANVLLLFYILRRMTGFLWRSAFVAALFAVHPLHVESVAWISERKDVLSTLFWMLTMLAYVRYAECPGIRRYAPVFVLLALGLMAKPMLVSLPIVLLLMDWWPLRRSAPPVKLVLEKTPLFALSAASCVVTYLAQHAGGAVAVREFPLSVRAANAVVAYVTYLWKMIAPIRLAAYYPHPGVTLPEWQTVGSTVLLVAITAAVIALARRKPYMAVGWAWCTITLIPVIGILQVGLQAMADRYTYIPLIGVFTALTWGIADLFPAPTANKRKSGSQTHVLAIPAVVIIAACAAGTWHYTGYWTSEITLCTRAIAVTQNNAMMHNNLGVALYNQGDIEESIDHFRKAIEISSDFPDAYINLGNSLSDLGYLDEAIIEYKKAIKYNPKDSRAYCNMAAVMGQQGDIGGAIEACRKAIELSPDLAAPHNNLARAYMTVGRTEDAIAEYRKALEIDPESAQAHLNLGEALATAGDDDAAMSEFYEALRLQPNYPEAHLNLGVLNLGQGKPDAAIEHYRQALQIKPDYGAAHHNLAIALYSIGDFAGAWREIGLCRECGVQPNPAFIEQLRQAMPEPNE